MALWNIELKWFQWLLLVAMALLKGNLYSHKHSSLSYHFIHLSPVGQMTKLVHNVCIQS